MKSKGRRLSCVAAVAGVTLLGSMHDALAEETSRQETLAVEKPQQNTPAEETPRYELSLGTGYRVDDMRWNIAGNTAGTNPNILSELTWDSLQSVQVNAAATMTADNWRILFAADYGQILQGDNQDSDYAGDNRTFEFSRSNNKGGGWVGDASTGIGYSFDYFDAVARRHALITPMLGYSMHYQHLTITDGVQTIPASGPIDGLDSSYEARWRGPWAGVLLWMESGKYNSVTLGLRYHWAFFKAEADWNLRDDFVHPLSFRHDSKGQGVTVWMEGTRPIKKSWEWTWRLEWQDWSADPGTDTVYFIDENTGAVTTDTTRLNDVDWHSFSATLQVNYRFQKGG